MSIDHSAKYDLELKENVPWISTIIKLVVCSIYICSGLLSILALEADNKLISNIIPSSLELSASRPSDLSPNAIIGISLFYISIALLVSIFTIKSVAGIIKQNIKISRMQDTDEFKSMYASFIKMINLYEEMPDSFKIENRTIFDNIRIQYSNLQFGDDFTSNINEFINKCNEYINREREQRKKEREEWEQKARKKRSYNQYRKEEHNNNQSSSKTTGATPTKKLLYFEGCKTTEEIKSKFRKLAAKYHPDNPNGDAEKFKEMKAEYESLIIAKGSK